MAKPIRAGIYVRISSDPLDLQEGVDRQTEDCLERAEALGWEVAQIYRDNNMSAWNARTLRPEYKRMTDDLLAGVIDAIIVWDIDRLLRRPIELERLIEAVEKKGGHRVVDAEGEYDLTNGDHQDILRHKAIAANKESRDKSRRVKRAALQRAKRGFPVHSNAKNRRPFGYDFDFVTVRPEEAVLIVSAARSLIAGSNSLSGICREWEARGVKTARGGKTWSYQALKAILISPRVAGLAQHAGEVLLDPDGNRIRAAWPAILNETMWDELRDVLTNPRRRTNHVQGLGRRYLLTGGLASCGACGENLVSRPREGRSGDNRCYGCGRKTRCGIRQTAAPLEDFVGAAVIEALSGPALKKLLRAQSGDDKRERRLVADLDRINRALVQLDSDYYDDLIPRERWLVQKARKEQEREEVARQLSVNGKSKILADIPPGGSEALRKAWDERGLKWRRALVSAAIERVVVHPDKRRGQNRFDPTRIEIVWRA